MDYILTFLEGIASFISPCLLPMVPIYISYFIGEDEKNNKKAILNSVGFVLGFTAVFLILSLFASQLGSLLSTNIRYIKIFFRNHYYFIWFKLHGFFEYKVFKQIKSEKYEH